MFALHHILKLLHKYNLKGLFFLTGHIAEKMRYFPRILDLIGDEEIGYHSSAHTVRPTIIEYTDVKDYALARQISVKRETKHINPLTGELEGKGGIILLRNLFPNKKIVSFRAPGFSYSPPHLEALKELGIRFDFSTNLSQKPVDYKNLTFYPYPSIFDVINTLSYASIFRSLSKSRLVVLDFHPNYFVNINYWDSIYFSGNPKRLHTVQGRSWKDTKVIFRRFELFLRRISYLQKNGVLEITPPLERGKRKKSLAMECVIKSYQNSTIWTKEYLAYNPRQILKHYMKFFDLNDRTIEGISPCVSHMRVQ